MAGTDLLLLGLLDSLPGWGFEAPRSISGIQSGTGTGEMGTEPLPGSGQPSVVTDGEGGSEAKAEWGQGPEVTLDEEAPEWLPRGCA